jgi:L-alanine-DL-glutamate epimerase-like enolase superfamily enzyme
MKITEIECHALLVPDFDVEACNSAQDDIVVRIHTDEGISGIGETHTNPWAAKALIEAPGTHCWKTGIGIAASAHLCAAASNAPFFEFLPAPLAESRLPKELVREDFRLVEGRILLPDGPGLGSS